MVGDIPCAPFDIASRRGVIGVSAMRPFSLAGPELIAIQRLGHAAESVRFDKLFWGLPLLLSSEPSLIRSDELDLRLGGELAPRQHSLPPHETLSAPIIN